MGEVGAVKHFYKDMNLSIHSDKGEKKVGVVRKR